MFVLRNVSYRYQGSGGISIDSLSIPSSGVVAVIGPSGSGKSTLLSILAGFVEPVIGKDGCLTFAGRPFGKGASRPGDIGFVFQSAMLLGAASGSVNMLAGHAARQLDATATISRGRVATAVDGVGMRQGDGALLARRARQLSGGEAQRISVLRALLSDPQVILCDEPTSSLDRRNAGLVMQALSDWSRQQGRPVIWVTHALDQAAEHADHFVFLEGGQQKQLPDDMAEALTRDDRPKRLEALQMIANGGGVGSSEAGQREPAAGPEQTTPPDAFTVSAPRYGGWLVRALATDGAIARRFERAHPMALAAPDHAALMRGLIDPSLGPGGWWARLWAGATSDIRYSMGFAMFALLALMLALLTGGSIGRAYLAERLANPAISRVVFEKVDNSFQARRAATPPQDLFQTQLETIEHALSEGIEPGGRGLRIYGRRHIGGTQVRVPTSPVEECREWSPFETMVIDADDPILRLAGFSDTTRTARAQVAAIMEAPHADAQGRAPAILGSRVAATIAEQCDVTLDDPDLLLEWALSDANADFARPVRLRVAAVVERMPPFHPYHADLVVFDDEFQDLSQRLNASPGPFFSATAYIPLDRFDETERRLSDLGYVIKDDSRAAIEELRLVQSVLTWLPPVLVGLALVAGVVAMIQFVAKVLVANEKVFSLYIALGLRLRDMLWLIARYTLPTVAFPLMAIVIAMVAGAALAQPGLDAETAELLRTLWIIVPGFLLLLLLLFTLIVVGIVSNWWWATARNLTEHLKDG